MIRTNRDKLVTLSVLGEITHPVMSRSGYDITAYGATQVLPGVGGITYSHLVGDNCVDLAGDHIEPGVSISNFSSNFGKQAEQNALLVLACIGNRVQVTGGEAKGEWGTVTGKHGGIEHVLVHFPREVLEKLTVADKMQVRATGQGLAMDGVDGVEVKNLDPHLFDRMGLDAKNGRLVVPVSHRVPARIMGSGLGQNSTHRGDYDIQMFDEETVAEYGLETLRFGDIVAIEDAFHGWGRIYKKGAISIGVVAHSNSNVSGHGPGVTTIFTSLKGNITPQVGEGANVADILGLKRSRATSNRLLAAWPAKGAASSSSRSSSSAKRKR